MATDYDEESQKSSNSLDKIVSMDGVNLTPGIENKFVVSFFYQL